MYDYIVMTASAEPTLRQIRYEIECLIDRSESDPVAITELAWMQETASTYDGGIPQSMYVDLTGPNSLADRVYTAVDTDVIETYGLFDKDTEKIPGYENIGAVKVPEWAIYNFLNDRFLLEENVVGACNNIIDEGGGIVVEDRLVWSIKQDESKTGWWIGTIEVDGQKLKAMYAGYLAAKCLSINSSKPTSE